MKNCPFREQKCDNNCALFISADELNETVVNRLRSIGVMLNTDEAQGVCSLKNLALAQSRSIFENTKVFKN
ncbi:MAG: hypothetical protein IJ877_07855 [Candidatus Gastranaerophilales bacterium]|nr:hypothetical protein [Candidatus Gastranaerophilales bacterium]